MAGEDPDVTLERLRDDHVGLAGPQLTVRDDDLDVQGHFSISLAFFSASSIPPTM